MQTTTPSPRAWIVRTIARATCLVVVLAAAASGCARAPQPSEPESAHEAAPATLATQAEPSQLAAAGDAAFSKTLLARKKNKEPGKDHKPDKDDKGQPGDDEDDADDVDHWKGVLFDVHNFDEVLDYLTTYYIDEKVDLQRAWIAAANGALGVLTPDAELLPTAFYEARKLDPAEEGRLDGRTETLTCDGKPVAGLVLHRIPSNAYLRSKRKEHKGRLSDEEIEKLRAESKQRYAAYRKAWAPLPFDRARFMCVMGTVDKELAALAARRKASAGAAGAAIGVWPPAAVIEGVSRNLPQVAQTTPPPKGEAATGGDAKGPARVVGLYDEDPDDEKAGRKRPDADMSRAWLAAASSYLYALDPHSAIISRTAWDESTRQTQDASFEGIGAVLYQRDEVTIIENPMEGLPAWKANVRAGDRILKVDGTDVRGWMLGKVVKLIRGPKNTKVVLTIEREGVARPFDVPIQRAHIAIKNVTGKLLKEYPGVAHVKMTGFVPRSARDLRDTIESLAAKAPGGKLTGLVLDLRRNSGGLLNRAIDIADMFLDKGRIVSVKSRRKNLRPGRSTPEETHEARDQPSDLHVPVVVLVNDGSASASEIVASAIQENGRGLVLGLRTFGKASVQTLFEPALHLDYYIKLTVARYYAPSGGTIQVTGVHPDKIVAPDIDGKIPVGFREENLTNHLEPIDKPTPSPWAQAMPDLDRCVARVGRAAQIIKREKNPQIRPDHQALVAADYLHCLNLRQTGAEAR